MNNNLHNRTYLKHKRKELRSNLTPTEAILWKSLQRKQLKGKKLFRRQHSIGNYIVDFYYPSESLIIELDGAYHLNFAQQNYDHEKTDYLTSLGFRVLRLENKDVFENLHSILKEITRCFK